MGAQQATDRRDEDIEYVPVLAALQGEFDAVATLGDEVQSRIRPIFEIGPPRQLRRRSADEDPPPPRPLKDHLPERVETLLSHWGSKHPLYLDAVNLDWNLKVGKENFYTALLEHAELVGLQVIGVTGPSRPSAQQAAAATHAKRTSESLAIRVGPGDLATDSESISGLLRKHQLRAESCDLIIDAGELGSDTAEATARLLSLIARAPLIQDWRRVITIGGSFPDPLFESVPNGKLKHFERSDWLAWLRVQRIGPERPTIFGDFTIHGPAGAPSNFSGAYSMRFTGPSSWAVIRGLRESERPSREYLQLATRMRSTKEWQSYPDGHCPGCDRLNMARPGSKPGNPTTWVSVAVRHHLNVVTEDLAIVADAA